MRFLRKEKQLGRLKRWALGVILGVMSLSCAPTKVNAAEAPAPSETVQTAESVKKQIKSYASNGMGLDFSSLEISIPSNDENHPNVLSFDGAKAALRLKTLSLHGLDFILDAPIGYNGLSRYFNLSLLGDDLFFSLNAPNDANAAYNVKYTANLTSYDDGGIDDTTKGISYYEYGELDYFVYTMLDVLGVHSIELGWREEGNGEISWDGILDAFDAMEEVDATRFRVDIPVDDMVLPIGLVHNGDYVLTGIEFPIQQSGVASSFEFENGLQVKCIASIFDASDADYQPPYSQDSYTKIVDSLALFRTLCHYVQSKKFGLDASFSLAHTEDAVEGDDDHFAHDAVNETAYLNLMSNLDFSESFVDGLNADIYFGQLGEHESHYGVYTSQVENGEGETDTFFYLDLNEILKVFTSIDVGSALISSLVDALSNESIQNEDIMKLLSSLLSSGEGILKVIDVVRDSAFFQNISNGYFESVVASVKEIETLENSIRVVVDLSQAGLVGTATILLNGTSDNAQLASVTLNNVGAKADNDTKTSLYINGQLRILPYAETEFDASSYTELTHLPGWTDEIDAIAEHDQLSVSIQGYALKLGTHSVITNKAANYNRTEQGFTFSGSLAFDLANRLGTGQMTFTDRKEAYVNDHTLQIDVTGPEGENDSDLNDMKGAGNENAMYFQYDSKNVTETKSSSGPYKNENRSEPDDDPLKGRFSIHSLDGILQVVQDLSGSTDVRFERLTSLVSKLSAETLLTKVMAGQYFELLASGVLESADIQASKTTIVVKPGVIQQNTGMTLILGYDNNKKPSTIEVYLTLEGDENDTEVYAKITLGEATFPGFRFSSHSSSEFTDYSSIKTLAQFGLDTIMLGMTDDTENSFTTYRITGSINLGIYLLLTTYNITISLDLTIYLKGTHVMIFGATHTPKVLVVAPTETACDFFYETDGSDEHGGSFYICRHTAEKYGFLNLQTRDKVEHRKVTGENFSNDMFNWTLGYILNLGDDIMDRINNSDTSASTESMHGEDIINGFSVLSASLTAPSWKIDIGLDALAHMSILNDLSATITGIQANYTGSDGKYYTRNALRSLVATTQLLGSFLTATITLTMSNINASSGAYTDGWNVSKSTYYTKYDATSSSATASSVWKGSNGKTSANSNYVNASWYTNA